MKSAGVNISCQSEKDFQPGIMFEPDDGFGEEDYIGCAITPEDPEETTDATGTEQVTSGD